jgi:hypothetical protein
MINDVISNPDDDKIKKDVHSRIDELTSEHPLYPELFTM